MENNHHSVSLCSWDDFCKNLLPTKMSLFTLSARRNSESARSTFTALMVKTVFTVFIYPPG